MVYYRPEKKPWTVFAKFMIPVYVGLFFAVILLGLTIGTDAWASHDYFPGNSYSPSNPVLSNCTAFYYHLWIANTFFLALSIAFLFYSIFAFLFFFFSMELNSWRRNTLFGVLFGVQAGLCCYAVTILAIYSPLLYSF